MQNVLVILFLLLTFLAETDKNLVAKVTANLPEWIKEAKSMEATITQQQPTTNSTTTPNNVPSNNTPVYQQPTYTPQNSTPSYNPPSTSSNKGNNDAPTSTPNMYLNKK